MNRRSAGDSVTLVRTIRAPARKVFEAWIDPGLLQRWGPQRAEVEARVGGHYRFETEKGKDSLVRHVVSGEYKELLPGRRIVKTWVYEGPVSPDPKVETLLTVEFREIGPDVVEVSLSEKGPTLADSCEREFAQRAWSGSLDELAALFAGDRTEASRCTPFREGNR